MRPSSLILLALAGSGAALSPALAQTALGNGRGLERDLRVGGGGLTPREDFGAVVRYRNAVVTGQAPGGAAFRARVGYTDSSDFTSRLGSDDLYRFRRDSLYSGLGGMGFRGTESLQYQFSQSTGNTRSATNPYTLQRVGGATPTAGADRPAPAALSAYQLAEGSRSGSLRSTSNYAANQGLKPVVIGYREVAGQSEPVAASTLLGIKGFAPRAYDAPRADTKSSKPDDARPTVGPVSAAPEPAQTAHDELRERLNKLAPEMFKAGPQPASPAPEDATKPKPSEKPQDSSTKPTTPEKPTPTPTPTDAKPETKPTDPPETSATTEWQRRVEQLRRAMKPDSAKSSPSKSSSASDTDKADKSDKSDKLDKTPRFDPFSQRLDKDTLALIRKSGDEQTKSYITEAQTGTAAPRDVYGNAMISGQKYMKTERYFDAEERFSFALSMKSGDPTAQAGRIHSQLASGLHVSAAANLRELIEQHPDTTGMRYSLDLLPALVRQRQLLAQLRTNIAGTDPTARRIPRESALLLAYLGYQRSDPDAIREGLSALKADAPPTDTTFLAFIEGIWLPAPKPDSKPDSK